MQQMPIQQNRKMPNERGTKMMLEKKTTKQIYDKTSENWTNDMRINWSKEWVSVESLKDQRQIFVWRCLRCGREVPRNPDDKDYLKDHYHLGKFCSTSQWKAITYLMINREELEK